MKRVSLRDLEKSIFPRKVKRKGGKRGLRSGGVWLVGGGWCDPPVRTASGECALSARAAVRRVVGARRTGGLGTPRLCPSLPRRGSRRAYTGTRIPKNNFHSTASRFCPYRALPRVHPSLNATKAKHLAFTRHRVRYPSGFTALAFSLSLSLRRRASASACMHVRGFTEGKRTSFAG